MTHNNKTVKRAACLLAVMILAGGSLTGCGKQAENAVSGNMKQEISASDEEKIKDGKKVRGTESDDKDSGKSATVSSGNKTSKENTNQDKDKESKGVTAGTEDKKKTDEEKSQGDKEGTAAETGSDKGSSGDKKAVSGSTGGNTGSAGTAQVSGNSGQSASAGNGDVKPSGSGQTAKPQAGSSGPQAGSGGNTAGSSSGNGASSSGSGQSAHTHSWKHQTKTVHHDAETRQEYVVDKPAWDEDIYQDQPVYQSVEKVICNGCGAEFADYPSFEAHSDAYIDQDDFSHGSWSVGWDQVLVGWTSVKVDTVHHDAVGHIETVVVRAAYDETVDQGYVCAGCGAIRS